MKILSWFICLVLLISPVAARHGSFFFPFNSQLSIGAGGWLVGGDIATDGTTIARTDTYGAWKLNKATSTWSQLVTQSSMPAANFGYAGVNQNNQAGGPPQEICQAPSNSSIVYMIYNGWMFKSTDGATTWIKQASFNSGVQVGFTFTSAYRYMGRRCAVDPQNPNYVYFGTDNNGLFVTTDGGTTWAAVSTASIPQSNGDNGVHSCGGQTCYPSYQIAFDPAAAHTCGAGTNQTCTAYVCNYVQSAGVLSSGIYATTDAGTGWTKTPSTPTACQHLVVAPTGNLVWIVDNPNNGNEVNSGQVWKYTGGTAGTWTSAPGSIGTAQYHSIAVDPADATHIIAFGGGGGANVSTSTGGAWGGVLSFTQTCPAGQPTWMCATSDGYMSNGDTIFDPSQSHVMVFFMGLGVWTAPAGTAVTSFAWTDLSKGIEQLVGRVVSIPASNSPVVGVADRATFYLGSANAYPSAQATTFFNNLDLATTSWVDYSAANTNFLVARITDIVLNRGDFSGTSSDGGQTWAPFNSYMIDVDATTSVASGTLGVIKILTNNTTGLSNWVAGGTTGIVRAVGYNNSNNLQINGIGQQYWYVQNIVANTSFELKNSSFAGTTNVTLGKIRIYVDTSPLSDWGGGFAITNITNNGSGLIRVTTADFGFLKGGQRVCISGVGGVTAANGCWALASDGNNTYDLLGSTFSGTYTANTGDMTTYANISGSVAVSTSLNYIIVPSDGDNPVCTLDGGQTWTTIYAPSAPRNSNVTAATWLGNVATYTTDIAHNIPIGAQVQIAGVAPSGYNVTGTTLTGTTGTTIKVSVAVNPGAFSIAGRARPTTSNGGQATGWGSAFYLDRVIIAADRITANKFYGYNNESGVYSITNCTATLVSNAGTPSVGFFSNGDFNAQFKTAPGNAGHVYFTPGPQGDGTTTHPAGSNLYRSTDGGVNFATVSRIQEVIAFGFGAAAPGHAYPTMYAIGWYDTTGSGNWVFSTWRSVDGDQVTPTWTNLLGANQTTAGYSLGSMDLPVDISGDPAVWNKWYSCWTNSGCSYGQQN